MGDRIISNIKKGRGMRICRPSITSGSHDLLSIRVESVNLWASGRRRGSADRDPRRPYKRSRIQCDEEMVHEKFNTRVEAKLGIDGVGFRGFHGEYEVTVKLDETDGQGDIPH